MSICSYGQKIPKNSAGIYPRKFEKREASDWSMNERGTNQNTKHYIDNFFKVFLENFEIFFTFVLFIYFPRMFTQIISTAKGGEKPPNSN